MSPIVLATYLVQAVSSAITAAVLLRFWGIYRREYLRLWGWSWAALATYQCAAGVAFALSGVIAEPAHPLRVLASTLSLAATGAHIIWLLQGALAMLRPVDRPPSRGRRVIALSALGITIAAVLVIAATYPLEIDARRLIRACVHSGASAIGFSVVAILLLHRATPRRGLGTRMLALGALAYAAAQIICLGIFIYDIAYADRLLMVEYAGLFNGLVQVVMSLGVVIWLLDDERSRAEEAAMALSESQERLRRLVEDVRLIAWEFDPTSKQFTFVSPQAERILGYSMQDWMQPEFWYNHVHPEDRERSRAYSRERTSSGIDYEFEYRMLKRDGGVVWFRDLTSIIRREGKSLKLHGFLIDITAQKEAEEQTALSEQRFRNLVQSSTDAIIVNQQGRIAFCNEAAVRMLGHADSSALLGTATMDLIAPSSRAIVGERIRRLSTTSDALPMIEERWIRADGREIEVEVGASAIEFGGKPAIQVQGRDITPRKDAERAVSDIARKLKAVVDAAPVVLWATDANLVFTLSEGRGLSAIGRSPGDVVGKSVAELYGHVRGAVENHRRALAGEVVTDTVTLQDVTFESRFAPVAAPDGRITGVIGVAVNVTERMRTEAALRESEERLRGVFDSAVDPLWDWDVANDQTSFSPTWPNLLEFSPEEFEREKPLWENLLHPDDHPVVMRRLNAALASDSHTYEAEYRVRTRSGAWKWVLSRGRVVARDASGQAVRMVGSIADITERKQSEQSLRESEALMRAVIENTPNVAIQGYDLDGRVVFWSPAATRLFGWSEEEALGKRLDALMLDADGAAEFARVLREVHRSGTSTDPGEWSFTAKDGRKGWCYSTIFEIPSGANPTFICMDVDITRRKEAEQALERSNHLQRLLLSELDHRVRNNLASLAALIDISSRDSRSVKDFAASIRTRVQAMSVVHALLSREHWQAVDLRQLILTLAPVGAQQALRISGPAVAVVPRQATALGMVVQELLVNSLKYGVLANTAGGGGHIDVQWSLDPHPRNEGERSLRLRWRERGGREISEPVSAGVGTGLVQGLVRTELRGEAILDFPREGASHEFTIVLDANEPESHELVAPVK